MFFNDSFTTNLNQLTRIIAEVQNSIGNVDTQDTLALTQITKKLDNAANILTSLFNELRANAKNKTWDDDTLQTRKGAYDNILAHYKEIKQTIESFQNHSTPNP